MMNLTVSSGLKPRAKQTETMPPHIILILLAPVLAILLATASTSSNLLSIIPIVGSPVVVSSFTPQQQLSPHRKQNRALVPASSPVQLWARPTPKNSKVSYVRPSAAIERGSGFFVPGLEGPKVRLLSGIVFLLLTFLNHAISQGNPSSFLSISALSFSESITLLYSLIVLLQGWVEYFKETQGYVQEGTADKKDADSGVAAASMSQHWYDRISLTPPQQERVEWVAATYMSLLPSCTHFHFIQQSSSSNTSAICYTLAQGQAGNQYNLQDIQESKTDLRQACQDAVRLVSTSNTGRLALPADHPIVEQLAQTFSCKPRCVLLQRVSGVGGSIFAVTSSQLLASFTPQDLTWLGQLAKYIAEPDTRREK